MRNKNFFSVLLLLVGIGGVICSETNYAADDLIYVPLDEPCRLVDTRSGVISGPIAANASESFLAYGNAGDLDDQGGDAAGCQHPKTGSTPVAIAANVTAVGNQATGNGNLVAYPDGGTVPSTSLLNYKQGTNLANSSIVALCEGTCTYDFAIRSNFSGVPALVDVLGYFYPRSRKNVITVSAENAAFTSPIDAINSIPTTGPDIPSSTNPYVIRIGPGTYDLGSSQLVMREWVDIKGGTGSREATVLTGTVSAGSIGTAAALVVGADNAELSGLTVNNNGGGTVSIAIANSGTSPKIRSSRAIASGSSTNLGIWNSSAGPTISGCLARAFGGITNYGIYDTNSTTSIKRTSARTTGGTNNNAVYVTGTSQTILENVNAEASGGSGTNYAVNAFSTAITTILFSTLDGTTNSILTSATATVNVSSSWLDGTAGGTTANNACFFVTDGASALDANCL